MYDCRKEHTDEGKYPGMIDVEIFFQQIIKDTTAGKPEKKHHDRT